MGGPFQVLDHHIDDALEHETKHSLNEKALADIITLCQERGLDIQGEKPALIQVLLDWKSKKPIPAPSTPRLVPSDEHGPKARGVPDITFLLGDDKSEIKYEDLVTEHKLGAGGFKDCYAGKYKGEPVAIGELRVVNFTDSDLKEMKHEINVLKQLRHENVVQFIGVCSNANHLCIITELCENGDLFDYMRKVPKPTFIQQVMFMHDISLGVTYLHNRRPSIIHRDLKSMNILISKNLQAKINDFGLARIRPRANASAHTHCGTPNWQAPEFWSPIPSYTEKVDVYACALIFWEIMTWGEAGFPYQNFTEHQLYVDVRDNNVRPPTDKLKNYPTPLLQLIESMWKKDPKSRPSMGNVVESLNQYLT